MLSGAGTRASGCMRALTRYLYRQRLSRIAIDCYHHHYYCHCCHCHHCSLKKFPSPFPHFSHFVLQFQWATVESFGVVAGHCWHRQPSRGQIYAGRIRCLRRSPATPFVEQFRVVLSAEGARGAESVCPGTVPCAPTLGWYATTRGDHFLGAVFAGESRPVSTQQMWTSPLLCLYLQLKVDGTGRFDPQWEDSAALTLDDPPANAMNQDT
jgi:hypothetical protein